MLEMPWVNNLGLMSLSSHAQPTVTSHNAALIADLPIADLGGAV